MRERIVSLEQRIAEAIAYCVPRAREGDPKHSLRTLLQPALLSENRDWTVEMVVRSRELSTGKVPPIATRASMLGGRLLVYFPDAELADGAAELISNGFFDLHNCPAWDTWLVFDDNRRAKEPSYTKYLLAFVPAELVALVDLGIAVNPEQCIAWLDDVDVERRDQLREFLAS